MINNFETKDDEDFFLITKEEAKQLWELLQYEYISHEFYPLIHVMLKRLVKFNNEHQLVR